MYRPKYLDDITLNILIMIAIFFILGIGIVNLIRYIQTIDLMGQTNFLLGI